MRTKTRTKREAFHREDQQEMWLVRTHQSLKRKDKHGREHCTITSELVWGKRVSHEGSYTIRGKSYHSLTGPTAAATMQRYADELNTKQIPPSELKRCKADGQALPRDGGPNQEVLALTLKPI